MRRGRAPLKEGCHQLMQIGRLGIWTTGSLWMVTSSSKQKMLPSAHTAAQYLPDWSNWMWETA